MSTLYTQAASNTRKTWAYLFGFLVLNIAVGWVISYYLQSQMILWIAVVVSVFLSFSSYWWSDKIVLSLYKSKPIKKQDNPELFRLVENLAITAGIPMPKIYIIPDASPNAFATGRNSKHATIAVTAGLLENLERVELEGVIAHELAHIGNRDILIQTVIVVLVGIIVIMTDFFFRISFWGGISGRRNERSSGGQAQNIIMVIALALAVLAPILAQLLKLAISRKREFLADSSGALLTRYPEGLARALEKISRIPIPVRKANNATAHLHIISPFRGKRAKNWLTKLYSTHPAVEDRVKALRGMRV